jgi:drug/metabolite transporter (DMT)-like permease
MSYKLIIAVILAILELLLIYIANRQSDFQEKKWFAIIFGSFGPRTDVPMMTKQELFRSARIFLIWTFHCIFCISLIVAGVSYFYGEQDPPMLIMAILCFILPLLTLIFLCSSVYLFLRGFFRRAVYEHALVEFLEDPYDDAEN